MLIANRRLKHKFIRYLPCIFYKTGIGINCMGFLRFHTIRIGLATQTSAGIVHFAIFAAKGQGMRIIEVHGILCIRYPCVILGSVIIGARIHFFHHGLCYFAETT